MNDSIKKVTTRNELAEILKTFKEADKKLNEMLKNLRREV